MDKTRALERLAKQIRKSKKCRLSKSATHAVPGEGPANAKIMIIGAAPGKMEDLTGRPFVGKAGKYLTRLLKDIGLLRNKVFMTSVEKYYPPANRAPKKDEIKACKPYLLSQIAIIKPKIVVLLGKTAESLKNEIKAKHIIITVHPAAAMRFPKMNKKFRQDIKKLKKLI
ncbi:uracil-DNA glycosylase [Candidatus Woesearchaeota archaeon]|nr:uracil-DNA glycosylase [Candidatus Woesearchaeota archaeon]